MSRNRQKTTLIRFGRHSSIALVLASGAGASLTGCSHDSESPISRESTSTAALTAGFGPLTFESRNAAGQPTSSDTDYPVLNGDGSLLLFDEMTRGVPPLSQDANNGGWDIYARTRATNALSILASMSVQGRTSMLSRAGTDNTGRYVLLTSSNSNATSNGIWLWDRTTNAMTKVDVGTGYNGVDEPVISADGSTVVYTNSAGNIAIYSRATATSQTLKGTTGQNIATAFGVRYSVNANGQIIAFSALANNVDPSLPSQWALFIADRQANTVAPLRANTSDKHIVYGKRSSLSDDGRFIAFEAYRQDVLGGVMNDVNRIWLFDRLTQTYSQLDCPAVNGVCDPTDQAVQRWADSSMPVISGDGSRVAFISQVGNLVAGDNNGNTDVFVTGTRTLDVKRLSTTDTGVEGNGPINAVAMSRNGNVICFSSAAWNLQTGFSTAGARTAIYCRSALAPTPITGTVTDVSSNAISGATVEVDGHTTTTDSNGYYSLSGIAQGNYTVHVRKDGWTFGSEDYMRDHYSVDTQSSSAVNVTGYNRNPIVYVRGFMDYGSVTGKDELKTAGYKSYSAPILNSFGDSPNIYYNADIVKTTIDQAKSETGQDKVVLVGYSMGGIISRAYLESPDRYANDVSQFFDYGSPHLGFPRELDGLMFAGSIISSVLSFDMSGVTDMSILGMAIFNLNHWDRAPGVTYHYIGGAAPLWRMVELYHFKIFGRRFSLSVPWPDLRYRNALGWFMGSTIISFDDDALFNTYSSTFLWGNADRFTTHEVHFGGFGDRWYAEWDGGTSQETFNNCLKAVLINGRSYCGNYSSVTAPSDPAAPPAAIRAAASSSANPEPVSLQASLTTPSSGLLHPNETVRRDIVVDGGQVNLGAIWQSGTATVTLIEPDGTTFTPDSAMGQLDPDQTTPAPQDTVADPNLGLYTSSATTAVYTFPNPKPGKWTVIVHGNADIPASGVPYQVSSKSSSTLTMAAEADKLWYMPATAGTFTVTLSESVNSATVTGAITLPSGATSTVTFSSIGNNQYRATYTVPNDGGDARMVILAKGTNSRGLAFERGDSIPFKIALNTVSLTGANTETLVPSTRRPGKYSGLNIGLGLNATRPSQVTVSAQLVDGSGNPVARVSIDTFLAAGANTVSLPFAGADIYASGKNGPYRVTNVAVVDRTSGSRQIDSLTYNVRTTGAYSASSFEGNIYQNHSYEAYSTQVSWATAKTACESAQGHLVTISSEGENSFVQSIAGSTTRAWLGMTDDGAEGFWRNITGESAWFTKWGTNEPNNLGGAENWGAMYVATGLWLDLPASWNAGYVCEWEPKPTKWTDWYNRDTPSGNGDNETLGYFLQAGQACANPTAIQCRRVSDQRDWVGVGNLMICTPSQGALCINADQPDGICDDIEVRFACPISN